MTAATVQLGSHFSFFTLGLHFSRLPRFASFIRTITVQRCVDYAAYACLFDVPACQGANL